VSSNHLPEHGQPNNPLYEITLEALLRELVAD
jgi:uncharacterized protein (DUF2132 family)